MADLGSSFSLNARHAFKAYAGMINRRDGKGGYVLRVSASAVVTRSEAENDLHLFQSAFKNNSAGYQHQLFRRGYVELFQAKLNVVVMYPRFQSSQVQHAHPETESISRPICPLPRHWG